MNLFACIFSTDLTYLLFFVRKKKNQRETKGTNTQNDKKNKNLSQICMQFFSIEFLWNFSVWNVPTDCYSMTSCPQVILWFMLFINVSTRTDKIFTCVQTRYLHVYKLVLFHTSMFEVIVIPVWSVFKYNVKVLFFPEPVLYIINFKCIKFALLIFIHKYLINYEKLILFCLHRNW